MQSSYIIPAAGEKKIFGVLAPWSQRVVCMMIVSLSMLAQMLLCRQRGLAGNAGVWTATAAKVEERATNDPGSHCQPPIT